MSDPARAIGAVGEYTKKYRMSVTEAGDVTCPCGNSTGKPMRSLGFKELYWFASRVTKDTNTPAFMNAVKAARILRAAHFDSKRQSDSASSLATSNVTDEDAKHTTATCRSCGKVLRISRLIMDRRSPRCYTCGGMLDFNDVGIVDEWLTLKEAAAVEGLAVEVVRSMLRDKDVLSRKIKGRWYIGKSSLRRAADIQRESDTLSNLMPFGDFKRGHICPHCKRVFRNPSAMSFHIKEIHHDF